MTKLILSLLLVSTLTFTFAQSASTIKVTSNKKTITIDSLTIDDKTKIDDVKKLLGEPSRVVKVAGKDRYYVYDSLGLSFDARLNEIVEAVLINYNWDEDEKAAKGSFKGELQVDGYNINSKTKSEEIKANTKFKEIVCIGAMLCISNPKKNEMAIIIGFNATPEITQITFGWQSGG